MQGVEDRKEIEINKLDIILNENLTEKCGDIFISKLNKIILLSCKFCKNEFCEFDLFKEHQFKMHYNNSKNNFINFDEVKDGEQFFAEKISYMETHEISQDHKSKKIKEDDFVSFQSSIDTEILLSNHSSESDNSINLLENILQSASKNLRQNKIRKFENNKKIKNSQINNKSNVCKYCSKTFSSATALNDHLNTHTGEKPYFCEICSKNFRCKQNLKDHERRHKGEANYPCSFCSKKLYSRGEKTIHERIHTGERPCVCDICGMGFTSKSTLSQHKITHNSERSNDYKCIECSKLFTSKTNLTRHFKTHIGAIEETKFKCQHCGKFCNSQVALNDHINTHTGHRPHICNFCPKSFKCRQTKLAHEKRHTGDAKYPCDRCEKRFFSSTELIIHGRYHNGERPCICELCGKSFINAGAMNAHKKNHDELKTYNFKCDQCEKAFSSNKNLKRHKVVHMTDKPFSCSKCSARFTRKEGLSSHLKIHAEIKEFKCKFCEKEFAQRIDLPENAINAEFHVWTVPDCFGTPNETPNRTWFYFSIRGGNCYQNVKITVKNLNRQAKLFSQGMTPVTRIGQSGHWHRIRDSPEYQNEEEHFVISFIHKVHNHPETEIFYAFTYPFSYKDCLNLLNKFDEKHLRTKEQIDIIIKQIYNKIPIEALLPNIEDLVNKQLSSGSLYSYTSSTHCIKDFETLARKELQNEIYYNRELLIKSLEGRRVDLITITSYHGIQEGLEKKLDNLFPEPTSRSHIFKNKQVIFLSSRVHPGETPASFVLNGFLNLILDRKNPVSLTLRRMYVFKIVPILNPDGVYHGYYRTDTLGQNLNRMYMETKLDYHPSIYAVKKLIKFYQHGAYPDVDDIVCDIKNSTLDASANEQIKYNEKDSTELIEEYDNIQLRKHLKLRCNSDSSMGSENVSTINMRAGAEETISTKKNSTQLCTKKNIEPKILKKGLVKTINGASNLSSLRNNENKLKDNTIHTRTIVKKNITRRMDSKINSNVGSGCNSSTVPLHKIISMNQNKGKLKSQIKTNACGESSSISHNLINGTNNLFLYIDMHGHASKKGVFMYGNHFTNLGQAVECMLLPKLMTINSQHFHFDACNFSEKNMYKKEKRDGLSKEGSGRVTIYKMTGLVKCYTLECNYNCGKYVNVLPSRNNVYSKQIMNTMPPKYTPSIYEEVGRALGPSILDLTNSNLASRLPNSDYRTLQGVRSSLRYDVDRTITSHNKSNTANVSSKVSKRRSNFSSSSNSTALSNKETAKENYREVLSRWNAGNDAPACSSSLNNSCINTHLQQPQCSKSSKLIAETSTLSSSSAPVTKVTLSSTKSISKTLKKTTSYKIRSSCLYGKKDSPNSITKKKAKILVETSNSSSGASSNIKKDHHQHSIQISNSFSANVPKKRVKVTLKSLTTVTNNKDKKSAQRYFKMQKNSKQLNQKLSEQNNISNSSVYGNQINSLSGISAVIPQQSQQILQTLNISSQSSITNSLPYAMSERPCFLLVGSSASSLSDVGLSQQVDQVKNNSEEKKEKQLPDLLINDFEDCKIKEVLTVPYEIIKKSSSTDSGLCALYKNSLYRSNSIQHLTFDLDENDLIETNTTELIKPENFNINNLSNFLIPSCSTKSSSTNSKTNEGNPPTTISDSNINNNDIEDTNKKNCEVSSYYFYDKNPIGSENPCEEISPTSSVSSFPTVSGRCKMKSSKSEPMIYKSRKMRKDGVNKKIIQNYFCATIENSKLKKKRRGFDSITIKHKKKIRNSRF